MKITKQFVRSRGNGFCAVLHVSALCAKKVLNLRVGHASNYWTTIHLGGICKRASFFVNLYYVNKRNIARH